MDRVEGKNENSALRGAERLPINAKDT